MQCSAAMKAWVSPRSALSPNASTCSPSDGEPASSSNHSSYAPYDAVGSPALSKQRWDLESTLMAVRVIAAWRLDLESVRREEAEAQAIQLNMEASLLQERLDSILGSSRQAADKGSFQFSSHVKKPSQAVARCVSTVVLNPAPANAEKMDRKGEAAINNVQRSRSGCIGAAPKRATKAVHVAVAIPVSMPPMPGELDARAMDLERWRAEGRPNTTRAGSASSSRNQEGGCAGYASVPRGRCAASPARVETSLGFGRTQQKNQPLRRRLGFDDVR